MLDLDWDTSLCAFYCIVYLKDRGKHGSKDFPCSPFINNSGNSDARGLGAQPSSLTSIINLRRGLGAKSEVYLLSDIFRMVWGKHSTLSS